MSVVVLILLAGGALVMVAAGVELPRALHRRRYARTLRNIDRLERELGLGEYAAGAVAADTERIARELLTAYPSSYLRWSLEQDVEGRWAPAVRAVALANYREPREVAPRDYILGRCELCHNTVALNAGRCSPSPPECAKVIWARSQSS